MAESEEELKSLLRVKEESEKAGLKLNIQRTNIMASGPIASWQIDGRKSGNSNILYSWTPKWTVIGGKKLKDACSLEEELWQTLDGTLKSRDITVPTKIQIVKAMVFPVVMYICESWTAKKAEHQRIDAVELWCWRTLLRVPWTARWSNRSILKEVSPEYSSEGLMLKLKHQYFGHIMWITDSLEKKPLCWKRLRTGGEGDDRG